MDEMFYRVDDVMALLGVSRAKAYDIIRRMNAELSEKGYEIIAGRISKQYFAEKFYKFSA